MKKRKAFAPSLLRRIVLPDDISTATYFCRDVYSMRVHMVNLDQPTLLTP